MIHNPYLKVIAIVCAGAFASCANPPIETTRISKSTSSKQDSSLTGQLLQEVNAYRRNHGAQELQRHAGMDRLAQAHCEFLSENRGKLGVEGKENVSHMGFEGRALLARQRYNMLNCAENVAFISKTDKKIAPAIVSMWASSKSHARIMRNSWTHTGVGIVKNSDGTIYATELFATAGDSQMTTRNRFNGL